MLIAARLVARYICGARAASASIGLASQANRSRGGGCGARHAAMYALRRSRQRYHRDELIGGDAIRRPSP